MKIYTKTGDKGDTSLAVGGRVRKSDKRLEAYGILLNDAPQPLANRRLGTSPLIIDDMLFWRGSRFGL